MSRRYCGRIGLSLSAMRTNSISEPACIFCMALPRWIFTVLFSRRAIALKGLLNRVQQILVAKRLRQKLHGTGLQSPDRHGYVAMCRNEYDWNLNTDVSQHTLEVEP